MIAMTCRVLLIQGHPDATQRHFGHALAEAYAGGAREAGHDLRTVEVATPNFPLLRSQHEWQKGELPPGLRGPQQAIGWAEHLVLFFPLWLGDMTALLKGFLEQVAGLGFAFRNADGDNPFGAKGLKGRSARVVVTMGMPAAAYRFYFRAHGPKYLERNILGFVGIEAVRESLVGLVDRLDEPGRTRWFASLGALGRAAD
jgi:putative NADPH-quinone reductase